MKESQEKLNENLVSFEQIKEEDPTPLIKEQSVEEK